MKINKIKMQKYKNKKTNQMQGIKNSKMRMVIL
jgi:hypothetical protein